MRHKYRPRLLWLFGRGKFLPWPVLLAQSETLGNIGSWDRAIAIYRQSFPVLEHMGDRSALAKCLIEHGHLLMLKGDYQEAEAMGKRSLALGDEAGDRVLKSRALNLLGNIANTRDSFDDALVYYNEALKEWSPSTPEIDRCSLLKNLGVVYCELGNYREAVACQKTALEYAEKEGRLDMIILIYHNQGLVLQRQQQYQEALKCFNQALATTRRIGSSMFVQSIHHYLGTIYSDLGKVEEALRQYQISLEYARKLGTQFGIAIALNSLGCIHLDRGCYDQAIPFFTECLELCKHIGHGTGTAIAGFNLGEISKELGDYAKAEEHMCKAVDYARRQHAKYYLCQALAGLADLRMRQGRMDEAVGAANESLALSTEINLPSMARNCRLLLARITHQDDPVSSLKQIESLLTDCPNDEERAEVYYWLYKLSGRPEDRLAALECYRRLDTDPENLRIKQRIEELGQG